MPRRHILETPYATAVIGLISGMLGGLGGRRLATLRTSAELGELYEITTQLQHRLARREGAEGAAVRRAKRTSDAELEAQLRERLSLAGEGAREHGPTPSRAELAKRGAALAGRGE